VEHLDIIYNPSFGKQNNKASLKLINFTYTKLAKTISYLEGVTFADSENDWSKPSQPSKAVRGTRCMYAVLWK
jgi:hypothetical protein